MWLFNKKWWKHNLHRLSIQVIKIKINKNEILFVGKLNTQVASEYTNQWNSDVQPLEKSCDGQPFSAMQIDSDEFAMEHEESLQTKDRTMRGLLAGDFRQTLLVIPRSTPAYLKYSILWKHIKTRKLIMNICFDLQNDQSWEVFSKYLLNIGNCQNNVYISIGCFIFPTDLLSIHRLKIRNHHKVIPPHCSKLDKSWLVERTCFGCKKHWCQKFASQYSECNCWDVDAVQIGGFCYKRPLISRFKRKA